MMTNLGQQAPDFQRLDEQGKQHSLSDYRGRWLVLYFYPKDATPGCTQEGRDFSELYADFQASHVDILGISKDSASKHQRFIDKQGFPFHLLVDEDGAMCQAYDVWVKKSMFGKSYMGIERATYLIDPEGVIQGVWRKVKVKGHAQAVIEHVRAQLKG